MTEGYCMQWVFHHEPMGSADFLNWGFMTAAHSLLEICLGDCIMGGNPENRSSRKDWYRLLCGSDCAHSLPSSIIQYARWCSFSEKMCSRLSQLSFVGRSVCFHWLDLSRCYVMSFLHITYLIPQSSINLKYTPIHWSKHSWKVPLH